MWQIVCQPEGNFPLREADEGEDENRSAMKVMLTDGSYSKVIFHVGFARRNTTSPDVEFKDALTKSLEAADAAVGLLNDKLAPQEGLV
jgi:hypothetical protein